VNNLLAKVGTEKNFLGVSLENITPLAHEQSFENVDLHLRDPLLTVSSDFSFA
jgi:hypothetical protein